MIDLPTDMGVDLLGVRIKVRTFAEVVHQVEEFIASRRPHSVYLVNAHTLNVASADPVYRGVLCQGDLVLNDGVGVRIAGRLLGARFRHNFVGTDFIPDFARASNGRGYRWFLLGALPGVADAAARRLHQSTPSATIVGTHHGFFDHWRPNEVIAKIRRAGPDLLLVAMGNPLQEYWIHRYKQDLRVPVVVGVGALLDYMSGRTRRAPKWMLKAQIEWAHRLLCEPRRLWRRYVIGNPQFLYRVLNWHFFANHSQDRFAPFHGPFVRVPFNLPHEVVSGAVPPPCDRKATALPVPSTLGGN